MRLLLGCVQATGKRVAGPERLLIEEYVRRCATYMETEWLVYSTEEALLRAVDRGGAGRTQGILAVFDRRGKVLDSEAFAARLGQWRDGGQQRVMYAVGPASGWSEETLRRADLSISLGAMTLPHALAQVVVAEQMYRALTILAGHPYHSGH